MESIDISLQNKIILITGGASGIGLSLTKQCHDLGAKVLVADLRTTPEFDTFTFGKDDIIYVQSDVTVCSDFDRMFAACEKHFGDVPDFYGICAGLFDPPFSNFWMDPEDDGYKQVEVNVSHPIKLTRLAIRKSLQNVCIIASGAGISGIIAAPLYCATKHAIIGFVKSMKYSEPLTGMKVTTICPDIVDTPMVTKGKLEQFSTVTDAVLSSNVVARHMLELLQEKKYRCGAMVEVTVVRTRELPEWNVSPPTGMDLGLDPDELKRNMIDPIQEQLTKDKGAA